MNYVDPSGHRPCDDEFDCSRMPFKNRIVNNYGSDYGLLFSSGSNYEGLDNDTQAFISAVKQEAQRMFDVYCSADLPDCGYDSPAQLYAATHGTTEIEFSNTSGNYCHRNTSESGGVTCFSGMQGTIDPILAAHEMGHVFNFLNEGYPTDDPYHDINNERATNRLFPALNVAIADGYNRHVAKPGEFNEDFANMYSMWVHDEWADPIIDTQRKHFMENNMYIWIQEMLNR